MPLYEYECFVCGFRFEKIQKVSAEPVKTCPECGGAVRRLLGVPALQFKGSGWYVTDYGKGKSGVVPPSRQNDKESSSSESPKKETSKPGSGSDSSKSSKAS